jgi:2-polyprenyl-3-methyl-5-hydroxy-6-metoxy-1,4-benzoquinol methylase
MSSVQPEGNFYDKYRTRNPLARLLMDGFLKSFEQLLSRCDDATSALEAGCGEGELSIRIAKSGKRTRALDISPRIVEEARRRASAAGVDVAFNSGSVYDLDAARDVADLVVCCEVLEHLEEPDKALGILHSVCNRYFLTSVPREPIWRALNMARGRYLADFGNTPGHVQHWSKDEFIKFLGTRFRVIEVKSPLPWTLALCEPRH